jgi:hypothetical protein
MKYQTNHNGQAFRFPSFRFNSLTPETRNLTPKALIFGAWDLGFVS